MNRRILVLSGLLVVQLGLAMAIAFSSRDYGAFKSNDKLLGIPASAVDVLVITDGDNKELVLKRQDDAWVLPALKDFPAAATRVKQLVDKLTATTKSWPVATTESAAARFKVSDTEFERKIDFKQGSNVLATLYLGTSPGFRKIHARVAGSNDIYAVRFGLFEAGVIADDWEDKDYLKIDEDQVAVITLPDVTLNHADQEWAVAGLKDNEQINTAELDTVLPQLLNPRFTAVMNADQAASGHESEPALAYRFKRRSGDITEFRYYKLSSGDDYLLKSSTHPYRFKVSKFTFDQLHEINRSKLVQTKVTNKSQDSPAPVDK